MELKYVDLQAFVFQTEMGKLSHQVCLWNLPKICHAWQIREDGLLFKCECLALCVWAHSGGAGAGTSQSYQPPHSMFILCVNSGLRLFSAGTVPDPGLGL